MAKKLLKKKAWDLFALYVKLRDANTDGICTCCTCGKELEFDSGDCQAGHFVSGRGGSVLFNEKVVHAQCSICNLWKGGEQGKYLLFMKKKYGLFDGDIEELLYMKNACVKFSDADMLDLIKNFYSLINMTLSVKFGNLYDIVDRVRIKLGKIGVKKMLDVDNTLGTIGR